MYTGLIVGVLLSFLSITVGELCIDDVDHLRAFRMEAQANITYWNELFVSSIKDDTIADADNANATGEKGYVMLEVIAEMAAMNTTCLDHIQSDSERIELFRAVVGDLCLPQVTCSEEVTSSPYRTFDGSCNNLDNPQWGMTGRAQRQVLPPVFENDIGSPRQHGVDGKPLPSARVVSNVMHRSLVENERDNEATVAVMAFGQFFDHDMVLTPVTKASGESEIDCCKTGTNPFFGSLKTCLPIDIPTDDNHFKQRGQTCMNLVRSAPAVCDGCKPCRRQQINDVTSYLDASGVYGSSLEQNTILRTFTNGLMIINSTNGDLPPKHADNSKCTLTHKEEHCFNAGDSRINVVPNQSTMHILFLREHNRIVGELAETNPHWDDERLFQEGRKINNAQMQHIFYNEYLPVVLGNDVMLKYQLHVSNNVYNDVYDITQDGTISSSFGAATTRFGHASIPSLQKIHDVKFKPEKVSPVETTFHNPHLTFTDTDGIIRWLISDRASTTNRFFDKGVRDLLFLDENNISLDLAAVDIQRGRDHGLPAYNKWREHCHLPSITVDEFEKIGKAMGDFDAKTADGFRDVYRHPDDIDLFSGAMSETKVTKAQVGPTFACLLAEGFWRVKVGDRFFYENPPKPGSPFVGFTEGQLRTIKQTTYARIICTNMKVPHIQKSVFRPACKECNMLMNCDDLDTIDVSQWREQP